MRIQINYITRHLSRALTMHKLLSLIFAVHFVRFVFAVFHSFGRPIKWRVVVRYAKYLHEMRTINSSALRDKFKNAHPIYGKSR